MPTPSQLQPLALVLLLLTAFVVSSAILRQCVSRTTAESVEAAAILGAIAAVFVWAFLRKGR